LRICFNLFSATQELLYMMDIDLSTIFSKKNKNRKKLIFTGFRIRKKAERMTLKWEEPAGT
jgi:hypothetical protein